MGSVPVEGEEDMQSPLSLLCEETARICLEGMGLIQAKIISSHLVTCQGASSGQMGGGAWISSISRGAGGRATHAEYVCCGSRGNPAVSRGYGAHVFSLLGYTVISFQRIGKLVVVGTSPTAPLLPLCSWGR